MRKTKKNIMMFEYRFSLPRKMLQSALILRDLLTSSINPLLTIGSVLVVLMRRRQKVVR